ASKMRRSTCGLASSGRGGQSRSAGPELQPGAGDMDTRIARNDELSTFPSRRPVGMLSDRRAVGSGARERHGPKEGLQVVHVEMLRRVERFMAPDEGERLSVGLDVELGVVTEGHLPPGTGFGGSLGPLRHIQASAVLRNARVAQGFLMFVREELVER